MNKYNKSDLLWVNIECFIALLALAYIVFVIYRNYQIDPLLIGLVSLQTINFASLCRHSGKVKALIPKERKPATHSAPKQELKPKPRTLEPRPAEHPPRAEW